MIRSHPGLFLSSFFTCFERILKLASSSSWPASMVLSVSSVKQPREWAIWRYLSRNFDRLLATMQCPSKSIFVFVPVPVDEFSPKLSRQLSLTTGRIFCEVHSNNQIAWVGLSFPQAPLSLLLWVETSGCLACAVHHCIHDPRLPRICSRLLASTKSLTSFHKVAPTQSIPPPPTMVTISLMQLILFYGVVLAVCKKGNVKRITAKTIKLKIL